MYCIHRVRMAFLKAILSILMGITCIFHFQQIYLIIQLLFLRIFIGPCKYVHQTDTCEDTFTIYISFDTNKMLH